MVDQRTGTRDTAVTHVSAVLLALPTLAEFTAPWRSSSYAPGHPDLPIERRFPPHITLLTPFAEADDDTAAQRLARVAAAQPPLELVFTEADCFPDGGSVWLRPEPDQAVRSLLTAVFEAFPELPPYGGLHADPTPHLTVTTAGDGDVLAQVRRALAQTGPLHARADELSVWVRGEDSVWAQRSAVTLGRG